MSESSEGPGWWQASDGKWYPPEQQPGYEQAGAGASGGAGGQLDLGSALGYGWNKFVQNIGEWIVIWLALFAVVVVAAIVGGVLFAGMLVTTGSGIGGRLILLVVQVLFGAVSGCVYIAIAKAALAAARGETPDVGTAFKLSGNNIQAGVIFGVAIAILQWVASWVCLGFIGGLLGIAAYMLLGSFPIISADQDRGPDALSEAVNLHTSNFGLFGVYWLLGGLIVWLTCGLGGPVVMLGGVYLYKLNRGETVAPV